MDFFLANFAAINTISCISSTFDQVNSIWTANEMRKNQIHKIYSNTINNIVHNNFTSFYLYLSLCILIRSFWFFSGFIGILRLHLSCARILKFSVYDDRVNCQFLLNFVFLQTILLVSQYDISSIWTIKCSTKSPKYIQIFFTNIIRILSWHYCFWKKFVLLTFE